MLAESEQLSRLHEAAAERAARLGRPILASTTLPSPWRDPIAFFTCASNSRDRALWLRPESGEALVGIGSAQRLTAHGTGRFQTVASAWRDLIADALLENPVDQAGPLLLGGFSFDTEEQTALWEDFPHASLVLPERLLSLRGESAWLTSSAIIAPSEQHEPRSRAKRLARPPAPGLSGDEWTQLVATVAQGIADQRLGVRKVVFALSCEVRPVVPIEAALRFLAENYPTCTIFAVVRGQSCFLGATPERLIALRDGTATTMALAASAPRGETTSEDDLIAQRLLADPKEREEHQVVVQALREALQPVCESVVTEAQPRVRKLSNLQHLLTPVRAQVKPGRGVLDLVERLHPTPAVGGFPRARALELIREREHLDRGWYAGPIGWVDPGGEGEFVVGLRSALVREQMATLFAGCGIVGSSNPRTEYAEWGWKLRPMLAALGADA
jgi:menaquinone-specific isochorismate synthase